MNTALNIMRVIMQIAIFSEAIYQFHHPAQCIALMALVWIICDLGTIARKYQ